MMTIDEIERRLQLPAPDEPVHLRPLILPIRIASAPLDARQLDFRFGRGRRTMPMMLVGVVLLLVAALVGAVLAGALRLEQLRDALPIPGMYSGRGISIDYPDGWRRLTPHDPLGSSGSSVALIVGNRDVDGCEPDSEAVAKNSPPPQPVPSEGVEVVVEPDQQGVIFHLEDRIYACLTGRPLEAGEVRLVVSRNRPQRIGVGPFGDFEGSFLAPDAELGGPALVTEETGFTETVGGMPARLIVRDRSVVPDADQLRTWIVAIPRSAAELWWLQAVIHGPDLPALEAEVDAVVRSLRFDDLPAPLDVAGLDVALATAIDFVDGSMRQYPGRRFLSCLPRDPDTVATTIDDAPRGRLAEPLEVTCTTTVVASDLRVWQADLEIAWAAGDDHDAGRWALQILFDSEGAVHSEIEVAPSGGDSVVFPGDPSLDVPAELPRFAPGDLVRSVGDGAMTAFYDVETGKLPREPHLSAEPGALMVVVSGPERYDGRDFYVADTGGEVGWVGVEAKGKPVLAFARPRCPSTIDATTLVYVSVLERRLCARGELELGPVQAATVNLEPSWDEVVGNPAWLADEPRWAIYGEGVEGLDPGLPVVLAPGLEVLPTDGWIHVRGHYDDPAAATCRVEYPEAWGQLSLPRDVEVRRCQERFVVTAVDPAERH
jgi:hypothetical protein